MGTGHGNAMAVAHQFSQHLGARHHWNTTFQGCGDFRVAGIDRAGDHQHISDRRILGTVADENLGAKGFEALGNARCLEIGTRDAVAQIEQHFGNTAHAHAADTDKVNTADTAHFWLRHGFLIFNHGPPPGRHRPRYGWHRAWPGGAR